MNRTDKLKERQRIKGLFSIMTTKIYRLSRLFPERLWRLLHQDFCLLISNSLFLQIYIVESQTSYRTLRWVFLSKGVSGAGTRDQRSGVCLRKEIKVLPRPGPQWPSSKTSDIVLTSTTSTPSVSRRDFHRPDIREGRHPRTRGRRKSWTEREVKKGVEESLTVVKRVQEKSSGLGIVSKTRTK